MPDTKIFPSFKEAASYARNLATEHEETISLKQDGSKWIVVVPEHFSSTDRLFYDDGWLEYESEMENEYWKQMHYQDHIKPYLEELDSYAEGCASSAEDGWFYNPD